MTVLCDFCGKETTYANNDSAIIGSAYPQVQWWLRRMRGNRDLFILHWPCTHVLYEFMKETERSALPLTNPEE